MEGDSILPLSEGQSEQIWLYASMSQIVSKTVIKLMKSPLLLCNYVIFCFGGQSLTFHQLLFLEGFSLIKKVGEGVNS